MHPPSADHGARYGQRAGGTHPTGMQSCALYIFSIVYLTKTGKNFLFHLIQINLLHPGMDCNRVDLYLIFL